MDLITVMEAARLLRRAQSTVCKQADRGLLPLAATLRTGERLFDREAIEQIARDLDRDSAPPALITSGKP